MEPSSSLLHQSSSNEDRSNVFRERMTTTTSVVPGLAAFSSPSRVDSPTGTPSRIISGLILRNENSEIRGSGSIANSSNPMPIGGASLGSAAFASVSDLPLRRSISTLQRYKRVERVAAELGDHPDVTNPSVIATMSIRNNSFHVSAVGGRQSIAALANQVSNQDTTTTTSATFAEEETMNEGDSPLPLHKLRSLSHSGIEGVVVVSSSEEFNRNASLEAAGTNSDGGSGKLGSGPMPHLDSVELQGEARIKSPTLLAHEIMSVPPPLSKSEKIEETEQEPQAPTTSGFSKVIVHLVGDDKAYTRRYGGRYRSYTTGCMHLPSPAIKASHTHFGYFAPAPPHPSHFLRGSKDDVTFVTSGDESHHNNTYSHFNGTHHGPSTAGGAYSNATGTNTAASTHPVTPHVIAAAPRTPGQAPYTSDGHLDYSSHQATPSHKGIKIGQPMGSKKVSVRRRAHSLNNSPSRSHGYGSNALSNRPIGTPSTSSITTAPTTNPRHHHYFDSTSDLSLTNRSSLRYMRKHNLLGWDKDNKSRHRGFIFDKYTHTEDGALRPTITAMSYEGGVTGRHLMLKSTDRIQIWKMAESELEENFYRFASDHQDYCDWIEMMAHHQQHASEFKQQQLLAQSASAEGPRQEGGEVQKASMEASCSHSKQTHPSSYDSHSFPPSASAIRKSHAEVETLPQHSLLMAQSHYEHHAANPPPSVLDPSFAADHPLIAAASGGTFLTEQDAALHNLWRFLPQFYGVYKVGKLEAPPKTNKHTRGNNPTDGGLTTASDVDTSATLPDHSQGTSKPSSFPTGIEVHSPTLPAGGGAQPPVISVSGPASLTPDDPASPTAAEGSTNSPTAMQRKSVAAQSELARRTRQVLGSATCPPSNTFDDFDRPRSNSTIIMPSHRYDTTKGADSETLVAQFELIKNRKCGAAAKQVPTSSSYGNLLGNTDQKGLDNYTTSPTLLAKASPCDSQQVAHRRANSYTDATTRPTSTSTSPRLLAVNNTLGASIGKGEDQHKPAVPPMALPQSFEEDIGGATPAAATNGGSLLLSPSDAHLASEPTEKGASPKGGKSKKVKAAESPSEQPTADSKSMIVLDDMCRGMRYPCVLDLKMGPRQYGLEASDEKIKSKEGKAKNSTTASHGVRLGGMKMYVPGEVALNAIPDKQLLRRRGKETPKDAPTLLDANNDEGLRAFSPIAAAAVENHMASLSDLTSNKASVACIRLDKICGRALLPNELGSILAEFTGSLPVTSVQHATGMDFAPAVGSADVNPSKRRARAHRSHSLHPQQSIFASVNTSTNKESSYSSIALGPHPDAFQPQHPTGSQKVAITEAAAALRDTRTKQLQQLMRSELKRFRRTFAKQDSFRFFTSSLLIVVDALDLFVGSEEEMAETIARHQEIYMKYENHHQKRTRHQKWKRKSKPSASGDANHTVSSSTAATPTLFGRTAEPAIDSLSVGTIPATQPEIPDKFHHRAANGEGEASSDSDLDDPSKGRAPSSRGYDSDCSTNTDDDVQSTVSSAAPSVDSYCSSCSYSDGEDGGLFDEEEAISEGHPEHHHNHNPLKDMFDLKIRMIDFAFTYPKETLRAAGDPDGFTNCDVGYLMGVDSLIKLLSDATKETKQ